MKKNELKLLPNILMPNPNQLYEDMEKLNALYEELCWDHDDELSLLTMVKK